MTIYINILTNICINKLFILGRPRKLPDSRNRVKFGLS